MKLKRGKRSFSTKINTLLLRPQLRKDYPHEFMNKMTDAEIKILMGEVRKILSDEEIPSTNINYYNKAFRSFIEEREDIYQQFKIYDLQRGRVD